MKRKARNRHSAPQNRGMTDNATPPDSMFDRSPYRPTVLSVLKYGMNVRLGEGALSDMLFRANPELERQHRVELDPPTQEAWARYYRAQAGMKALEAYEGTEWGGPDYGTEVPEPAPTPRVIYTETEEDHAARLKAAGHPTSVRYVKG